MKYIYLFLLFFIKYINSFIIKSPINYNKNLIKCFLKNNNNKYFDNHINTINKDIILINNLEIDIINKKYHIIKKTNIIYKNIKSIEYKINKSKKNNDEIKILNETIYELYNKLNDIIIIKNTLF